MSKHLPGSLHIYLCNIRLGIPRSSWRPWNFIMLSRVYIIVLNITILSVKCTEIRQCLPPASASPMGWYVNVSPLLEDTYYVKYNKPGKRWTTGLLPHQVFTFFFYYARANVQNNLFVFRGNYVASHWLQFKVLLIGLDNWTLFCQTMNCKPFASRLFTFYFHKESIKKCWKCSS